jgi:SulP family sulfate permease
MDVLCRYAEGLAAVGNKLVLVSTNDTIEEQIGVAGITDVIGPDNVYRGSERVGASVQRAQADAVAWVEGNRRPGGISAP